MINTYGDLRPVEEALIARVRCCTTCLKLPSDGQLGFCGNVVNFLSDIATVNRQLPCSPANCGIIRYRIEGQNSKHKLKKVRKAAVGDWLKFLSQHHTLYRDGVRDMSCPLGTSRNDDAYWIVPPFKYDTDVDASMLASLPDDDVPFGLPTMHLAEEDMACEIDADAVHANSESEESDDEEIFDAASASRRMKVLRRLKITSALVSRWLRTGSGIIVQDLRARLERKITGFGR